MTNDEVWDFSYSSFRSAITILQTLLLKFIGEYSLYHRFGKLNLVKLSYNSMVVWLRLKTIFANSPGAFKVMLASKVVKSKSLEILNLWHTLLKSNFLTILFCSSLLIPNVSSIRTEYLIDIVARNDYSVLLTGEQVRYFLTLQKKKARLLW